MLVVPSGQQGHGFESSRFGMESAQGISAVALVPTGDANAVATGADSSSCAATSTYIRGRTSRRFTVPNIGLQGSDRQPGGMFPVKSSHAVTIGA